MELKHYFKIVIKKIWLIAIIVAIGCIIAGIKSYYLTTPLYQANAKLIVNQSSQNAGAVNMNTLQMNIMLINSYKEIIKSPAILNKVYEEYPELKVSPGKISVASANNSQIMNLIYDDTSYENAAKSINAIAKVFKEQIPSIMNIDNVTILSGAIEVGSPSPYNSNPPMNIAIAIAVSLMLGLGLVFLLDYLDNTYKTEAELESDLGLPTLALVMNMNKEDIRPRNQSSSKNKKVGEGAYATINR
ncbi:YveK family protein [Paenibacillus nasutitermitis]|uniref:Capsular polysaccharide biosynthesis protein n=1 Tax=Paenibacillus nasutitermitis TaxID=1652958 RepID=A0A917DVW8_9BACL|nr:Wzz/FepE/Etk N-terminal domain-containing protein [Paenibacillus nasutitermitis]GGD76257.1 capsular polysaccharide biosynthesis protein [Paenibacillus nasutitermitis]